MEFCDELKLELSKLLSLAKVKLVEIEEPFVMLCPLDKNWE